MMPALQIQQFDSFECDCSVGMSRMPAEKQRRSLDLILEPFLEEAQKGGGAQYPIKWCFERLMTLTDCCATAAVCEPLTIGV